MDATEPQWRARVGEAARKAADELRETDSHYHRDLIEDLEDLADRVGGEADEPQ